MFATCDLVQKAKKVFLRISIIIMKVMNTLIQAESTQFNFILVYVPAFDED